MSSFPRDASISNKMKKEKCRCQEPGSSKSPIEETQDKKKLTADKMLKFIFLNEERADVHFSFPNEIDAANRLPGHKLILATRSDVFAAQFSGRFSDEDECQIKDVGSEAFREFLRYLYTDTINVSKLGIIVELLYLSEKYLVHPMKTHLIHRLNKMINKHNVLELLTHPLSNHLTTEMKENVFLLLDKRIDHVLESQMFLQLPKDVIREILQRDTLQSKEITIYNGMIKWAQAECKRMDWSTEADDLRRALDELLHLIRFPTMSGEEFNNGPVTLGIFDGREAYDLLLCINSLQLNETPIQQGEASFYSVIKRSGPKIYTRPPHPNWQPPMIHVDGDRHRPFGGGFNGFTYNFAGFYRDFSPEDSSSEEGDLMRDDLHPPPVRVGGFQDHGFNRGVGAFAGGFNPARGPYFGDRIARQGGFGERPRFGIGIDGMRDGVRRNNWRAFRDPRVRRRQERLPIVQVQVREEEEEIRVDAPLVQPQPNEPDPDW